jgi:hypothetical protein
MKDPEPPPELSLNATASPGSTAREEPRAPKSKSEHT